MRLQKGLHGLNHRCLDGLQARCSFHTDSCVALEVTRMLFTFHFGLSPYGPHMITH